MGQPDDEIHRARSGEGGVPSAGASVPVELGCVSLPVSIRSPTWKVSKPKTIGIFMEASSCRHDQLLTPFLGPFPFLEKLEGRAENSKLLIMTWSFW